MISRLLIGLSALLCVSCSASDEPSAETLVRDLMDVWRTGDTERLASILAEDVVYDDAPNNRAHHGVVESAAYVRHVHTWASEVKIEIVNVRAGKGAALAEWRMSAVQSAPIAGRIPVATMNPVVIRGVTIVETENGRITRAADYLDALGFVLQLGAGVDLPGGVRIGPAL
ncbi:MAG: nuclear transport factor 2 family protein [Parvularculaceae bacterium]|nr:nuclear transport factor 2 family protein [Parvularculaceae bacterium]